MPWNLFYNLAPQCGGSQLRGSHTPAVWVQTATEVAIPYSCHHLQQLEQVYPPPLRPKRLPRLGGSG